MLHTGRSAMSEKIAEPKLMVGDTVLVKRQSDRYNDPPRECTISKITRTHWHVDIGRESCRVSKAPGRNDKTGFRRMLDQRGMWIHVWISRDAYAEEAWVSRWKHRVGQRAESADYETLKRVAAIVCPEALASLPGANRP